MVVSLVFEEQEPGFLLFPAAFTVLHVKREFDGAGVYLLGFVEVRQFTLGAKEPRALRRDVHEAYGLLLPAEFLFVFEIALESLSLGIRAESRAVYDGVEGGMPAVVGPVGVDHAQFGDGGVAPLLPEHVAAEEQVVPVHRETVFIRERVSRAVVELPEAGQRLDGSRMRVFGLEGLRYVEGCLTRLDRVYHVSLDLFDILRRNVPVERVDFRRFHGGALAHRDDLYALRSRIGTLVELTRQVFGGEDAGVSGVGHVVGVVELRLREHTLNGVPRLCCRRRTC